MKAVRSMKSTFAALTLLGAGLAAGGALAQETLRIGAINPFSGPLALYGDELTRGYQVAIDERNASGGVLGRKIELVRGDATNPQQGIAAVDQLATRERVEIFVGTYVSAIANAGSDAAMRPPSRHDRRGAHHMHCALAVVFRPLSEP